MRPRSRPASDWDARYRVGRRSQVSEEAVSKGALGWFFSHCETASDAHVSGTLWRNGYMKIVS